MNGDSVNGASVNRDRWKRTVILGLILICLVLKDAQAQIVEERKGEANPVAVLFRATLYGAGTGLLLGGAYALLQNDPHVGTWDILRWSVGGGAIGGFLIGLIYVASRPSPPGARILGLPAEWMGPESNRILAPGLGLVSRRDGLGRAHGEVRLRLVQVHW